MSLASFSSWKNISFFAESLLAGIVPIGAFFLEHIYSNAISLQGPGGLADCGNAQNCVKACPKDIPLTTSIAEVGRQLTKRMIQKLFD